MENIILLLFAAIAPVIAGLGYIFAKDRYHKEPAHMLIGAFVLGIISIVPIIFIEFILSAIGTLVLPIKNPIFTSAWTAFIVAALTEESFKYLCLYLFIWNSPEFDERFDGIVYGVFISLGFACAENIGYVFLSFFGGGVWWAFTTSVARAIFSIPCHFCCGVILGYYLSLAKFEHINRNSVVSRGNTILKGFLLSAMFHGIFDFIQFYGISFYPNSLNEITWDLKTILPGLILFIIFLVFNILFWRHSYKRINHLASLLRPNPLDEPSAFITCSFCGKTYESDMDACPNCKQLTYYTLQAQYYSNNNWTDQYYYSDDYWANQDLHNLNSFPPNHEMEPPPRNPNDFQ